MDPIRRMFQVSGGAMVQRGTPIRSISAIVPAYNSAASLFPVVTSLLDALLDVVPEFEVLIVDDGSIDATPRLADELATRHQEVSVLHLTRPQGYASAWRHGIAAASKQYVLLLHVDAQVNPGELDRLVQWNDQYDMVLGYRIRRGYGWHRVLLAFAYRLLVRMLFGVGVKDAYCGFKLFRAQLLKRLSLQARSLAIDTEIVFRAMQLGATYREVGVSHVYRRGSQSWWTRLGAILEAGIDLFLFWRRLRRERQRASAAGLSEETPVAPDALEEPPSSDL